MVIWCSQGYFFKKKFKNRFGKKTWCRRVFVPNFVSIIFRLGYRDTHKQFDRQVYNQETP